VSALTAWLADPQDYEAGRLLYDLHGHNHVLKRTLSHGANAYNRSALVEELTKLARTVPAEVALHVVHVAPAPGHVAPAVPAGPGAVQHVTGAGVPPVVPATQALLLSLDKQWKPLYKEASFLQSQLEHAKDNQQRGTWSHRILDLMEEVQTLWDSCAYVQAHGQLPPVPVVVPPPALGLTDRAAVTQRRNNLRAQVSKQKNNAERAAEVAEWKEEIAQLNHVLTALDAESKEKQPKVI